MASSRHYILAVTLSLIVAGLAIRQRTRLQQTVRDKAQVHTWENEGGNTSASGDRAACA